MHKTIHSAVPTLATIGMALVVALNLNTFIFSCAACPVILQRLSCHRYGKNLEEMTSLGSPERAVAV